MTTPTLGSAQIHFLRDVKGKLCSEFGENRSKIELSILSTVAGRRKGEYRADTRNSGEFMFCPMLYIALDRQK